MYLEFEWENNYSGNVKVIVHTPFKFLEFVE